MSTSTIKMGANMALDQSKVLSHETIEARTSTGNGHGHVKIDELLKLQDSTRKLLCVLEELQSKTLSKAIVTDDLPRRSNIMKPLELSREESMEETKPRTINDVIGANAMKMLEYQTRALDRIVIEEEDDCSVYKKLTRKCSCLTRSEYNDFVILFNEDTKYCTGVVGEIIKNIKIVKKFLYMGGCYMKSALLFLNEDLAATFLYKLAETEEGRRYINLNSRIACDIKRFLKKNTSKTDLTVIDALKSVMETCQTAATHSSTLTYTCFHAEEDLGNRMLNSLTAFRQYMSIGEVFSCLEELLATSNTTQGKKQLTSQLLTILNLFKSMLLEYDDSAMNILMTNIMNRLMDKSPCEIDEAPRGTKAVNTATEPVKMIDTPVQSFEKKKHLKKSNIDKNRLSAKPCLTRQNAKGDPPVPPQREPDKNNTRTLNRSRRFIRDPSIIIVPIDKQE